MKNLKIMLLALALCLALVCGCRKAGPGQYTEDKAEQKLPVAQEQQAPAPVTEQNVREVLDHVFAYCDGGLVSVKKYFADAVMVYGEHGQNHTLDAPGVLEMLNRDCLVQTRHEIGQIATQGMLSAKAPDGGDCRAPVEPGEAWAEIIVFERFDESEDWSPAEQGWYLYMMRRDANGVLKINGKYTACPAESHGK
jgi:hypothetical protein